MVFYIFIDDIGNIVFYSFDIEVIQVVSLVLIVDVLGNGQFNVLVCEDNVEVVFFGNVYDCDLIVFNFNFVDLIVSGVDVVISYFLLQEDYVYFEVIGNFELGDYFIVVSYQGVMVDYFVMVEQDVNQFVMIMMFGNFVFFELLCVDGVDLSFQVQIIDDCDVDFSGVIFILNGGVVFVVDVVVFDEVNGFYVWNFVGILVGFYIFVGIYIDGVGVILEGIVIFMVIDQFDNFVLIIIYLLQNINIVLDLCFVDVVVFQIF